MVIKKWILKTLSRIFWMRFFFKTWCISMIFLFKRRTSCIGHFFFMCCLLTFLFHSDNTSFLPIFFGEFWQESYAGLWEHYGSRVMGVYSGPFSGALGLTTNLFWWYRPFIYGGLCTIYFFKELGFGGSIYVF